MDHGPNRKAPTRLLYHDRILASVTLASLDSRKGKMPRRFVRLENAGAVGNEIRHPNLLLCLLEGAERRQNLLRQWSSQAPVPMTGDMSLVG